MCSRASSGDSEAPSRPDHGDLEFEVEQFASGRDRHVVGRPDQRVRIGEIERRRLVPLRHHLSGDARHVLLEGDEVADRGRGERRQQPDRVQRHGWLAERAPAGRQGGGQPGSDQVKHALVRWQWVYSRVADHTGPRERDARRCGDARGLREGGEAHETSVRPAVR